MTSKLNRTTFRTSREMDFFSEKELVTQTGHEIGEWPLVIIKELVDNSLDACEEADVAPIVDVVADGTGIEVRDNGPGLPETTLKDAMDFSIRASNREAYVSPCRGAQGNALKTLLPMPRVVDSEHGGLVVEAHGRRHVIRCGADPISQRAVITDDVADVPKSKKSPSRNGTRKQALSCGTMVRLEWREQNDGHVVWPFDSLNPHSFSFAARFRLLVEGFALFNPHATFRLDWFGMKAIWKATEPSWKKWKPSDPTSSHWYEQAHFERLISAYLTHDRDSGKDRLVSDLIAEFDGLSGSVKRTKVLDRAGLKRCKLSELAVDGRLDSDRIGKLLSAMKANTRPVKSVRLGVIGEDHFRTRLLGMGAIPESFHYARKIEKVNIDSSDAEEKASFLPWVLETAFGYLGPDADEHRKIIAGVNWSAAIKNPFRSFGSSGEGLEAHLTDLKAGAHEPIVFVIHLAQARVEYTDRGKSALIVGGEQ